LTRVCFCLQVKRERMDDYKQRHREVWPEMREALSRTGWHNYSLFLREDGLLVGYLETDDFERAKKEMAQTEVNARWQQEMAPLFEAGESTRPDEQMKPLTEVFHLE
jgi:L-rhamnose mutarotase